LSRGVAVHNDEEGMELSRGVAVHNDEEGMELLRGVAVHNDEAEDCHAALLVT